MRTFGDVIEWLWSVGETLGKTDDETLLDAARRVVAERDEARAEAACLRAASPNSARNSRGP